jgi:hypothetical protein
MVILQAINDYGTYRAGRNCAQSMIGWYDHLQSANNIRDPALETASRDKLINHKAIQDSALRKALGQIDKAVQHPTQIIPSNANGVLDKIAKGLQPSAPPSIGGAAGTGTQANPSGNGNVIIYEEHR